MIDKEELLKRFPEEFSRVLLNNAVANNVFYSLLSGQSPYMCIYWLIKMNQDQFETLLEVVNQSVPQGRLFKWSEVKKWASPQQLQELFKLTNKKSISDDRQGNSYRGSKENS